MKGSFSQSTWARFSDLKPSDVMQLECIGISGYTSKLRITATSPAVLVLLAFAIAFAVEMGAKPRFRGKKLLRHVCFRALPWVLLWKLACHF